MKPRYKQARIGTFSHTIPKAHSACSWWIGKPQAAFTEEALKEQARMSAANITGRVSVPEGWR